MNVGLYKWKRLGQKIGVHWICRFPEIYVPELDFAKGTWKIGIVERHVKSVYSQ